MAWDFTDTSHEEWLRNVNGTTRPKTPEDAEAIARLCAENNWPVFHAFSTFYKVACYCARCAPSFRMPPGINQGW